MDRVEHAVARVVGIEEHVDQAGREITLEREPFEQAGPPGKAVEIEVRRELPGLLVEDI
jgi:hypothetical protein